ncbi:MAG: iron-containing alcohol dehydrogenase, partial [Lentisphaerae bacterium]|nr:iron-containing alcohol dehydrogenase [Lentisphaerota bacterium]
MPTRKILYAEQALDVLADVCRGDTARSRVHLFADARTWIAAGQPAERKLKEAGLRVRVTLIPDSVHGDPVCDDLTLDALKRDSPTGDVFLAVGSGAINDLVKWLSRELAIPYVVLATAASMNGYASNN